MKSSGNYDPIDLSATDTAPQNERHAVCLQGQIQAMAKADGGWSSLTWLQPEGENIEVCLLGLEPVPPRNLSACRCCTNETLPLTLSATRAVSHFC